MAAHGTLIYFSDLLDVINRISDEDIDNGTWDTYSPGIRQLRSAIMHLPAASRAPSGDTALSPIFEEEDAILFADYVSGRGEIQHKKIAIWSCPTCGDAIGEMFLPDRRNQLQCNFCPSCGQKLDWTGVENAPFCVQDIAHKSSAIPIVGAIEA